VHEALRIAIVLSPFILLPVAGWMEREEPIEPAYSGAFPPC
jgi:hypothetical protein